MQNLQQLATWPLYSTDKLVSIARFVRYGKTGKKLPSIEVGPTAIAWPMTLTFNLLRAMVTTYSCAKVQGQRSVGSEDEWKQTSRHSLERRRLSCWITYCMYQQTMRANKVTSSPGHVTYTSSSAALSYRNNSTRVCRSVSNNAPLSCNDRVWV